MSIIRRDPNARRPEEETPEAVSVNRDELLRKLGGNGQDNNSQSGHEMKDEYFAGLPFMKRLSAKNSLAIDIATDRIYYLTARKSMGSVQVKEWGVEILNTDEVDRYRSIEMTLKYIRSKFYRAGMTVDVGFFSPDINVRQVVVPKLKQAELEKAILYKNKTDLANFGDDSVWKYEILETFKENDTEKLLVLVTVVPGEVVDLYLDILRRSGLKPGSLIPRPFAFLAAYRSMVKQPGNDVVVDISGDITQIAFIADGKLRHIRNFGIGAINLNNVVASGEEMADNRADSFPDNDGPAPEPDGSNLRERLLAKVQSLKSRQNPLLQVLLGEILRSLEFFRGRKEQYSINNVYISGAGLKLEAVYSYLKNRINYPLYKLTPCFSNTGADSGDTTEFVGVLGVGLSEDKNLNMVPAEFTVREKFRNLNMLLAVLLVMAFAGMGYQSFYQHSQVSQFRAKVSTLNARYEKLNPVERIYQEFLKNINSVERQKIQLVSPVKPVPQLFQVMKLFSNEVPPEMRLTALRFTFYQPPMAKRKAPQNGSAAPENPYKYRVGIVGQISGDYLMGDVQLINFINHLNDLHYFKKIKLLNKIKQPENKLFEFELEAYL